MYSILSWQVISHRTLYHYLAFDYHITVISLLPMCLSFDDNLGFQKIFLLLSLSFFNFYFLVSPWYVKVYFFVYWDFLWFFNLWKKNVMKSKNSIIDSKFCLSFILFLFCFSLSLCIYIWPSSELHEVLFVYFPFYIVNVSFYFIFIIIYLYIYSEPLFLNYETFLCITIQLLNLFICITWHLNDQYFLNIEA